MAFLLLLFTLSLADYFLFTEGDRGCPESNFIGCVTRLRIQRVPFDKNMLNVVFSVTSEAKLRHTCRAYSDALPCFRDRIVQCGNDKQRRMLDEVRKMIMFFCSPFSVQRQEKFLRTSKCIGEILQMPATTNCYMDSHQLGKRINSCREECYKKREFLCMMKIWISEQSLCTLIDIEKQCGESGTDFYTDLQQNVFDRNFPVICDVPDNITFSIPNNITLPPNPVSPPNFPSPLAPRPSVTERPLPPSPTTRAPFSIFPLPTRNPFVVYPPMFTSRPLYNGTNSVNAPTTVTYPRPPIEPRVPSVDSNSIVPSAPQFPPVIFRPGTWNNLGNPYGRSRTLPPSATTQSYFYGPETSTGTTRWLPWYLRGSKPQGRQAVDSFPTLAYPKILWPTWSPLDSVTIRPNPFLLVKKTGLSQEYNSDFGGNPSASGRVSEYQWFSGNGSVSIFRKFSCLFMLLALVLT